MTYLLRSLMLLSSALAFNASDHPRHVPVGFIESISGRVTLVTGADSASSKLLDKERDKGRVLFLDESFHCAPGAGAKGAYLSGGKTVPVANFCEHSRQPAGFDSVETTDAEYRNSLATYGKRMGRDKGSESPICEPAQDASILPEKMVVRWRTRPPIDSFAAVLQDASGKSVAEVPGVDGAGGSLDSGILRDALRKLQAPDKPVSAALLFKVSTGDEYRANFTVISETQERDLRMKLAQASATGGLLAHVLRADVFASYGLYGDVAAEYGLALEEAPSSLQLLSAALDAYARIGDLAHAKDVRDRLDKEEERSSAIDAEGSK